MSRPRLLCIVGPTASGKTALALELAERLGGEIVSADSRQVYRTLDVGTAKPTAAERARVCHHCLDLVDPGEPFDAARFGAAAAAAIADIHARGRVAIVAGGTGLYLRALLRGLCPAPPRVPPLRAALARMIAERGAPAVHRGLAALDPPAARRIDPHDARRIVRALEVGLASGRRLSEWQAAHAGTEVPYDALAIGLARPVAELDARIAARARAMVAGGFVDEVRALRRRGLDATAPGLEAVGYAEMLAWLEGRCDAEAALAATVRATRRLAKRQRTWFRGERDLAWRHPEAERERLTAEATAFIVTGAQAHAGRRLMRSTRLREAVGAPTYLDFERALEPLDAEIARLTSGPTVRRDEERLRALRAEHRRLQDEILARLTPWERVRLSRHPDRPGTLDYVGVLFRDFVELHGDRRFGDDGAVVGGPARFRGRAVMVVGHQRGRGSADSVVRNFGMPRPEGFRKAVRLFQMAERFARPIITFVDTQGAYPGMGAEERGQAEAIAACLQALGTVRVPVVSAVIGEGGSGGALALAVGDVVLMQEHAWYSVLSPEGCASILFRERTPATVARTAALLRLTATDLLDAGVIDDIVREPGGGAHRHPARAAVLLGRALEQHLTPLANRPPTQLVAQRYARYRRIGTNLPPV